jgi:hypothetical protein
VAGQQFLTATDGSDFDACRDGSCTVAITKPPVGIVVKGFYIQIQQVSSENIVFEILPPGGHFSDHVLSNHCEADFSDFIVATTCPRKLEPPARLENRLAMQFTKAEGEPAVVRFAAG